MRQAVRGHEDILRAVAGLSWVLLLFGLLYLIAAVAPDSGMYWDVERQSTTAWIGIGFLTPAVPLGGGGPRPGPTQPRPRLRPRGVPRRDPAPRRARRCSRLRRPRSLGSRRH